MMQTKNKVRYLLILLDFLPIDEFLFVSNMLDDRRTIPLLFLSKYLLNCENKEVASIKPLPLPLLLTEKQQIHKIDLLLH